MHKMPHEDFKRYWKVNIHESSKYYLYFIWTLWRLCDQHKKNSKEYGQWYSISTLSDVSIFRVVFHSLSNNQYPPTDQQQCIKQIAVPTGLHYYVVFFLKCNKWAVIFIWAGNSDSNIFSIFGYVNLLNYTCVLARAFDLLRKHFFSN